MLRGAISAQRTDWQIGLTKGKISLQTFFLETNECLTKCVSHFLTLIKMLIKGSSVHVFDYVVSQDVDND